VRAPARIAASFRKLGNGRRRVVASPRFFIASAAAILTLASALVASAPAQALISGHAYDFTFGAGIGAGNGQFETSPGDNIWGMGIAVDQSTGDVYVADPNNSRIQKFSASGQFLQTWGYGVANGSNESQVCSAPSACQKGLYGAAPGQFRNPTSIAVDNSGGESDGAVYVADTYARGPEGLNAVLKFTSNGTYLGKITGADTPGGSFSSLSYSGAIAVDKGGFLWVADGGRVMRFTGELENEYVGGSEFNTSSSITSFATNSAGSRIFIFAQYVGIFRFSANGFTKEEVWPTDTGEAGYALGTEDPWIAVDPSNEHVYLVHTDRIREYGLDNKLAAPIFGPGFLTHFLSDGFANGGLAVNETTGDVFAADPRTGTVFAFKPRAVPTVETMAATDIGHDGATLRAEVAPEPTEGGDVTSCHFDLGTDTSYGTSVPCEPATPYSGPNGVSAAVSGLPMETTYHYRIVASNSIDANPGQDRTFTTHAVLGIKTEPATEQTPDSMTLNGSFDPAGIDTHYYFEWGADTSYGNVTAVAPGVDAGAAPGIVHFSAPIEDLSSYTKYHYRIVASNSMGTSYGEDEVGITAPPNLPTISETFSSGVAADKATVGAAVNPNFGDTFYRFEYGPTDTYGLQTLPSPSIGADGSDHRVSIDLSGLKPGTTYHFRAIAVNFGGVTHGPDMTFTTQDAPKIESANATSVTQTTATISARINPSLITTTYQVQYGTSTSYGWTTPPGGLADVDNRSHPVSASVDGLTPGTTYHYRVVANNPIGTTVSVDQVFTTLPLPPQRVAPQVKCKKGFVRKHGKCVKRRHSSHRSRHKSRRHG
jgi:hypothetical protein